MSRTSPLAINRTLEPVFFTVDRNHDLIKVPLVVLPWPVASDAGGKLRAEAIDPETDSLSADNDTMLGQ